MPERDQLRQGMHTELLHEPRAMAFDGARADAEATGALLVAEPRGDKRDHLALAPCEPGEQLPGLVADRILRCTVNAGGQGLGNAFEELLRPHRLFKEADGAAL